MVEIKITAGILYQQFFEFKPLREYSDTSHLESTNKLCWDRNI